MKKRAGTQAHPSPRVPALPHGPAASAGGTSSHQAFRLLMENHTHLIFEHVVVPHLRHWDVLAMVARTALSPTTWRLSGGYQTSRCLALTICWPGCPLAVLVRLCGSCHSPRIFTVSSTASHSVKEHKQHMHQIKVITALAPLVFASLPFFFCH